MDWPLPPDQFQEEIARMRTTKVYVPGRGRDFAPLTDTTVVSMVDQARAQMIDEAAKVGIDLRDPQQVLVLAWTSLLFGRTLHQVTHHPVIGPACAGMIAPFLDLLPVPDGPA